MKIVILHNINFFEVNGANSNRWRALTEGLDKRGIEITLLISNGYNSFKEYKKFKRTGKVNNIKYYYTIPIFNLSPILRRITKYIFAPILIELNKIRVKKLINQIKPDLIWLTPHLSVLQIFLKLSLPQENETKVLIELNEFEDIGITYGTNWVQCYLAKKFKNILLLKILPRVDYMIVMTQKLLEHYKEYATKRSVRILHVPMTVDLERFSFIDQQPSEDYIAYCGSTSFNKDGVDVLLYSFVKILNYFPEIRLKIAAPLEQDGDSMLKIIKQINCLKRIDYLGKLTREEIPEFLSKAKLLVLPRPLSKQAEGGFPTKLGEYLATGNPVCITYIGEIPDYLRDNQSAFFAVPGDVDSFSDAMIRALTDYEHAKKVGLRGRKIAEQYFSNNVQTQKLYSFLVDNLHKNANV